MKNKIVTQTTMYHSIPLQSHNIFLMVILSLVYYVSNDYMLGPSDFDLSNAEHFKKSLGATT